MDEVKYCRHKPIFKTRILLAIRFADELRDQIQKRDGTYSGSMAPNLQSIIDVLAIPDSVFLQQLEKIPKEFLPKPEYYGQLEKEWDGSAPAVEKGFL